jgi:hypothetical protein
LPVLLTDQTGLSGELTKGMVKATLRTAADIVRAVNALQGKYDAVAREAATLPLQRTWAVVAKEWVELLSK